MSIATQQHEPQVEPQMTESPTNMNDSTDKMMKSNTSTKAQPTSSDVQARVNKTALAFGEIVALLSRSPLYKHMSLADLEWLVIPALMTNQVTSVRGKLKDQDGLTIPLGLAMWAYVSEEVDKKLEAQKQAGIPFRLAPQDWKSGDIPWLLAVVAPKEASQALVKKLEETVFQGKTLRKYFRELPTAPPKTEATEAESAKA
ncbi:toxin-activating lysine-acyltransferase [Nitrospira sp. M1]